MPSTVPLPFDTSQDGKPLADATRVMIIDDSLIIRTILARIIAQQPDLDVICKTSSAELALKELVRTPVDVILLDLAMPGMGGIDALPKIFSIVPDVQILVVSSLTEKGAKHTLTALSMGAADTLAKPRAGEFGDEYSDILVQKIRALGKTKTRYHSARPNQPMGQPIGQPIAPSNHPAFRTATYDRPEVVAIGASTGGIHALCSLLGNLPQKFTLPILVTQHLPSSFMAVFAQQLAIASSRSAVVAEDEMIIAPRTLYIAPGNGHLTVRKSGRNLRVKITQLSVPNGCIPSIDPMLESLAQACSSKTIAIILSGMGRDGALGAKKLANAGGTILAQDQASSSVWGMPRAVTELGLASALLSPAELAAEISAAAGIAIPSLGYRTQ